MKKLNKQVAKNRISCFLENNQVVLFFHCKNSVSLKKNDYFLHFHKKKVIPQSYGEHVARTNVDSITYKKHLLTNQSVFKSIMVKNRLAKKAFLDLNKKKYLAYFAKQREESTAVTFDTQKCARLRLVSHNEQQFSKKGKCSLNSLFQGPTLLLGCSNLEMLEKGINACAKYKNLILLGALYDQSIISHSQVKRLIVYSNNNQGYVNLLYSMRNPFLQPFSLIQKLLTMPCFLAKQKRLISLLKVRKQQIADSIA